MYSTQLPSIAKACAVKESTAWSYACRAVELRPELASRAILLVDARLVAALHRVDLAGSLREVLVRLPPEVLPENAAAHLRLARLCLVPHAAPENLFS